MENNKELLLRLIRDSLINIKLISGLNFLGLNANDYSLYLGDSIFFLMGFEDDERSDLIFESVYLANAEKVKSIDFSQSKNELDLLSLEIYNELVFAKNMLR
jgi:hypothetical protein